MLNKRALLVAVATAVVACGAIFFAKSGNRLDALFDENVEALLQSESYGESTRCLNAGGTWNSSACRVDGGAVTVECTTTGQISVKGETFYGDYVSGCEYTVQWELYACITSSSDTCCYPSDTGVKLLPW